MLLLLLIQLLLLLLLLVLLLLLLQLKLSLELLLLYLMQDHKKVHCRVWGRGVAAGGWRPLCVVDRCRPAARGGDGELLVAAARWPCCRDAAWVAILNPIVPLLAGSLRPTRVT